MNVKEGGFKIFHVADWVKEWQENDIIDDKEQYCTDYKDLEASMKKASVTISPALKEKIAGAK